MLGVCNLACAAFGRIWVSGTGLLQMEGEQRMADVVKTMGVLLAESVARLCSGEGRRIGASLAANALVT